MHEPTAPTATVRTRRRLSPKRRSAAAAAAVAAVLLLFGARYVRRKAPLGLTRVDRAVPTDGSDYPCSAFFSYSQDCVVGPL